MNAGPTRRTILSLLGASLASPGFGQGFADLGATAEGFAEPRRGRPFSFPADHGPHPDHRIEWWYLTANLKAGEERFGVQWTLFRAALRPEAGSGWATPQIWLGHAAMTSADTHLAAEKLGRGGVGAAGAMSAPFAAWVDDWRMAGAGDFRPDRLTPLELTANGPDWSYDLNLAADGPIVPHGDRGFSVKSAAGQASHYYSQPHYTVTGRLIFPDREVSVEGSGWLDREWSSRPLTETQDGWDWFSLRFEAGTKLMAFRLRDRSGPDFTAATWIGADGSPHPQPNGAVRLTPRGRARAAGRDVPVEWRVELPAHRVDIVATALNPGSWNALGTPYWEGPVLVEGSHRGEGYLEMTGY